MNLDGEIYRFILLGQKLLKTGALNYTKNSESMGTSADTGHTFKK